MTIIDINPFFARRINELPDVSLPTPRRPQRVYAKLPIAPITGSPVPELTSLYHNAEPGPYGDRGYPGNCGGNLIRDLLLFFQPHRVFDPLTGSGTCRDVCRELKIDCISSDIHTGIDACDPSNFFGDSAVFQRRSFDFCWIHPPYYRMKLYAEDPRDLSRAKTFEEFLERYGMLIVNCASTLKPGGILSVLMGDYTDRDEGFLPLTYHTKRLAFECGLRQHCTDIIRFSHGASSSRKTYRSSFIPGLHDVCTLFQKPYDR